MNDMPHPGITTRITADDHAVLVSPTDGSHAYIEFPDGTTYYAVDPVLADVQKELERHARIGYDAEHDDKEGLGHLVEESHRRTTHFGEFASPAGVRHELVVGSSLLIAGAKLLDRADAREAEDGPGES